MTDKALIGALADELERHVPRYRGEPEKWIRFACACGWTGGRQHLAPGLDHDGQGWREHQAQAVLTFLAAPTS